MGFRLNRTYVLDFEGDLKGLEVRIRSTSIATMMEFREADKNRDVEKLLELLVEHVVDWNIEAADGAPLPLVVDAIKREVEEAVVAKILRQWYLAATGVTAPLDDGSTSGAPFPEPSIPMDD